MKFINKQILNLKSTANIESILYFSILFAIFFSPKINFDLKILYLDFYFFGYLIILIYVILKKNRLFLSKKIIFLILLFFTLHFFFLSGIYDTKFYFLKQFFIFILLFQLFINLAPNFNIKKFLEFYIKFSTFVVLTGYIIFTICFLNSSLFFKIINEKNLLEFFSTINFAAEMTFESKDSFFFQKIVPFFSLTSPVRFQGFINEPATYAILIIPFLYICIKNIKKNKIITILTFFSILLSQSLYGYLGLTLILFLLLYDLFLKNQKKNFLFVSLILLLIVITTYFSPVLNVKIINITKSFPSILNIGFDNESYENNLKSHFRLYSSIQPDDKFSIVINNERIIRSMKEIILNSKIKKILNDKKDIEKINKLGKFEDMTFDEFKYFSDKGYYVHVGFFGTKNYIGSTACSYVANLFIILNDKKFILTGTGLGSHEKKYNNNIHKWQFTKTNQPGCLNLNKKDAKSIYLRVLSELGIIVLIPFIFLLFFYPGKDEEFQKTNIHTIAKIFFTIKALQIGKYYDLSLVIFFFILIISTNFKKISLWKLQLSKKV